MIVVIAKVKMHRAPVECGIGKQATGNPNLNHPPK